MAETVRGYSFGAMTPIILTDTQRSAASRRRPKAEYFPDRGCHVAPRCLTCRRPLCVFDEPESLRQQK